MTPKNKKEQPQLTEQQRALAASFAKGMLKSIHGRFGADKAAQVLSAMKGLAEAVSPEVQKTELVEADLEELQHLANAAELQDLVKATENSVEAELQKLMEDSFKETT